MREESWRILDPICREHRRAWRWRRIGGVVLDALAYLAIVAVLVAISVVVFSGAGNV